MSTKFAVDETIAVKPAPDKPGPEKPKADPLLKWAGVGGAAFFIFSLAQLDIDYRKLWEGTFEFIAMLGRMFPPDASQWGDVLSAAAESLQIAVVGTLTASLIAFALSFLAAENIAPSPGIAWALKGFASLLRSVPILVWALVYIVAVGMGPLPGILAIITHGVGMQIKLFAQSIEEVDEGVVEALRATGAGWLQIVLQGVLPAVWTALIAWCIMRFEGDIGDSTILGVVGAGGIGHELSRAMRLYQFDAGFFIVLIIFAMVFTVEMLGNRLKMAIRK